MNVLILTKTLPESPNDWSGNFVREQVRAISAVHTVTVVKCKIDYNRFSPFFRCKIEKDVTDGYENIRLIVAKSFPVYNQFNFLMTTYFALKPLLKSNKIDIIHCHYSYPSGIIAWLIKKRFGIPYIITEHSRMSSTFRSIFHKSLSLIALKQSNRVISVSKSLAGEIAELKIRDVEVVPNVIDTSRFATIERESEVFTIGFLGSLNTDNKGLDLLIKACSSLTFKYKLRIGGTGILLQKFKTLAIEAGIADNALFLGNIEPQEIERFYSSIDLFVLPSRYETFGVVLIEALASGIPVVATKCGGPEDIITDECGLLTDTNDSTQLGTAIESIFLNYKNYRADDLRMFVKEKFGVNEFINRMNLIYRECCMETR